MPTSIDEECKDLGEKRIGSIKIKIMGCEIPICTIDGFVYPPITINCSDFPPQMVFSIINYYIDSLSIPGPWSGFEFYTVKEIDLESILDPILWSVIRNIWNYQVTVYPETAKLRLLFYVDEGLKQNYELKIESPNCNETMVIDYFCYAQLIIQAILNKSLYTPYSLSLFD